MTEGDPDISDLEGGERARHESKESGRPFREQTEGDAEMADLIEGREHMRLGEEYVLLVRRDAESRVPQKDGQRLVVDLSRCEKN